MKSLNINGRTQTCDVADDTPLLWALRDELGLTGSKFGCGQGICGACTVMVDGAPMRSCTTPVSAVAGRKVKTIEGLEQDRVGRVVQDTWVAMGVAQCGFCQAGQITTATALLKSNPHPSEQQIKEAMSGNICRCGTYTRINAAIKQASVKLASGAK